MWVPLAAVAVAAALGLAQVGRPRHLARAPLRAKALGALALAAIVVADVVEVPGGAAARLGAAGLAAAFLVANLHVRGAAVAALGIVLGAVPLAVNGAVTVPARTAAAIDAADGELGPARRLERPDDRLRALSAVIPVPGVERAVSFPDLVAAAGLIDAGAFAALTPRLRRRRVAPPPHPSARYATVSLATALDIEGAPRPAARRLGAAIVGLLAR